MTQLLRFIESSLAQEFQAHVDFQRLCEKQLTNAYGGLLVMALDWPSGTCGKHRSGVAWWSSDEALHGNMLQEKLLNKVGDLGIEPRSQYL